MTACVAESSRIRMSFPKKAAVLSVAARSDLSDILLYTEQQWGAAQRERYALTLQRAITNLVDYLRSAHAGPDCFQGAVCARLDNTFFSIAYRTRLLR